MTSLRTALLLASLVSCAPSVTPRDDASTNTDARPAQDADNADAAAPVEGQWTFVPSEEMRCGDGSATGYGINLSRRSSKVLFVIQGGGACWDVNTCFVLRSAANLETGYTAATFAGERATLERSPMLDRSSANNPFRDATFVYVPYCTGDMHSGRRVFRYEALGQTRDIHHVGARNMDAVIARIRATVAAPERVWLYGISAGGYGAIFNWWRFVREFAGSPVDVLSDCGVPVTPPDGRYVTWLQTWNSELPPSCPSCDRDMTAVLTTQLAMFRARSFAQLAYTDDQVLTLFYGLGPGGFAPLVRALHTRLSTEPNARTFVLTGSEHVMAGGFATLRASDGTALSEWIPQWASASPAWTSHAPY